MSRPARAKPTRSLRCSIDVEPSCDRTTSSIAWRAAARRRRRRRRRRRTPPPPTVAVVGALRRRRRSVAPRAPAAASAPTTLRTSSSLDPRALDALAARSTPDRAGACRPCRSRRSAPCWSRITRLSVSARHREREAGRDVGLDDTGDHVDRRALRGDHEVDADRAGHLGDAADRVLDVARRDHHQVVELVDDDEDERQPRGTRRSRARLGGSSSPRSKAAL